MVAGDCGELEGIQVPRGPKSSHRDMNVQKISLSTPDILLFFSQRKCGTACFRVGKEEPTSGDQDATQWSCRDARVAACKHSQSARRYYPTPCTLVRSSSCFQAKRGRRAGRDSELASEHADTAVSDMSLAWWHHHSPSKVAALSRRL